MTLRLLARRVLLILDALVAVTALAGGGVLTASALLPGWSTVLAPPVGYLDGSPFASYLVPGLLLGVVLGGIHLIAFLLIARRSPNAVIAATVAGYATLIWILVQMTIIPFSFLQAIYAAAGLAEIGLVLIWLGVFGAAPAYPAAAIKPRVKSAP